MSAYERDRTKLEERILEEAPRFRRSDRFKFACHPGVRCFGDCCGNVNILLTPRDVLRLKQRLGINSSEFLGRYTILPRTEGPKLPAPLLKMQDNDKKTCPFLGKEGCSVYEDRPWACRMYPIGYAASLADEGVGGKSAESRESDTAMSRGDGDDGSGFWFLLDEEGCHGFDENHTQTISEWLDNQRVDPPDQVDGFMRELVASGVGAKLQCEDRRRMQMLFMALYDLDTFRRFLFDSTFMTRFELDADLVDRIAESDEDLLAFAIRWLEFSLLGRASLKVKNPPEHQTDRDGPDPGQAGLE